MKNWKDTLIAPDASILKAIEMLDAVAMQIALVVDEHGHLLGTVTDGDIRRGILRCVPMESPVRQIMHQTPVVSRLNDGRDKILSLMKLKGLRQIPVVDENGIVIGMEILDELIRLQTLENRVVLMAGGMGSRLRPLTDDCPKPLIQVGSKPILETILENFIEYGFRHFTISVNYKADMIERHFQDGSAWGVTINYIRENRPMGTAGPLGFLAEKPTQPILVMNGDLLTKVNFQQLLEFHRNHQAKATMCVREYDYQIPYGVARLERHQLTGIEEKPVQQYFVNAGVYVLEPEVLELIPQDNYFDMPELFKMLIARGAETVAFPIMEYWIDIGRMDDLERAKMEYAEVFK